MDNNSKYNDVESRDSGLVQLQKDGYVFDKKSSHLKTIAIYCKEKRNKKIYGAVAVNYETKKFALFRGFVDINNLNDAVMKFSHGE